MRYLTPLALLVVAAAIIGTRAGEERTEKLPIHGHLESGILAAGYLERGPVAQVDTTTALCPFDATATGGGYYQVFRGDSLISEHTRLDQAIERAARIETVSPADSTRIEHDFQLRIECPEDWVQQVDSVTLSASEINFHYKVEGSDTTWTVQAYKDGERIDSMQSRTYQLTALVWLDGSVVGCSGECSEYAGTPVMEFRQAAAALGFEIERTS